MDDDRYEVGEKVGRPPNPEESLMIQIGTILYTIEKNTPHPNGSST